MGEVNNTKICSICCEQETKSLRKIITCNYCKNETCKKCTCRYLLETKETPHCMHCRKEWNPDFVYTIGTNDFFHNKLPENLAKNLLEKEKMKLPETQALAEHIIKIRKLKDETTSLYIIFSEKYEIAKSIIITIYNYDTVIFRLRNKLKQINTGKKICKNVKCTYYKKTKDTCPECQSEFYSFDDYDKQNIKNKLKELYIKEVDSKKIALNSSEYIDYIDSFKTVNNKRRELCFLQWGNKPIVKKKFIKACPNESCKGFLSSQWKCGICDKSFCKDCHIEKQENHTCNEDTKKTVALLKKDTRPCPKCGTGIFKIDGCNQMWCVDCKTAFDWNTGEIAKGVIHNPHYFQWLNETGGWHNQQVDVDLCNGLVDTYALRDNVPNIGHWRSNSKNVVLYSYIRIRDHLTYMSINYYQNTDEAYTNLRVKYLLNELTEAKWIKKLKMYLKKHEYNSQVHQIFQMHSTTINELLLELLQHKDCNKSIKQLEQLTEYTTKHLENIAKIYKRKSLHCEIIV